MKYSHISFLVLFVIMLCITDYIFNKVPFGTSEFSCADNYGQLNDYRLKVTYNNALPTTRVHYEDRRDTFVIGILSDDSKNLCLREAQRQVFKEPSHTNA